MVDNKGYDLSLQHPFSMIICGSSRSGKTQLCVDIVRNKDSCINKPIKRIIYCHTFEDENSETLSEQEDVVLVTKLEEIDQYLIPNSMVIIDDKTVESSKKYGPQVMNYFLRMCSHSNISIILILHRLFLGNTIRTISLNASYIVFFKNPRDSSQIKYLAREIYPNNSSFLVNAYEIATNAKPFSYILIDLLQTTPDFLRIRSSICISKDTLIFKPTS